MKIALIFGTRPEIIKLAPIIDYGTENDIEMVLIHTGQHYSYEMDAIFLEELKLPKADYHLDVGSGTHGEQTGKMLQKLEQVLTERLPGVVLVQGDTNTAMAGALAAVKLNIPVGHVEAGIRSYYRIMPEEINRVVTDHVADYHFAPTPVAREILLSEGLYDGTITVTGNTVVDALMKHRTLADKQSAILQRHVLQPQGYFLVTAHRPENVDDKQQLALLLESLRLVSEKHSMMILWPIHPRTQKHIADSGLSQTLKQMTRLKIIPPVGYLDFLKLQSNARLILTDSGGIQEEACILGVPCVTLRENTERPETVAVGANVLTGVDPDKVLAGVTTMLEANAPWINPFGNGDAAELIVKALQETQANKRQAFHEQRAKLFVEKYFSSLPTPEEYQPQNE